MKIKQLLGGLMAMATLATCAFGAVGCSKDSAQGVPVEQTQVGGMVISEGKSNGISMMAKTISAGEYADYGVAATAESAFQITATVKNNDGTIATGAKIDWSLMYEDGETDVTEITVTPTSDGAWTATVACLEGYSYPIIITASLRDDSSMKATCRCEYVRKISLGGTEFELGEFPLSISENISYVSGNSSERWQHFELAYKNGGYTLSSEYKATVTISFEDNIADALEAQGFSCFETNRYTVIQYTENFAGNLICLRQSPGDNDYAEYGEFCDIAEFEAGNYNDKIKQALGTLGVGTKIATIKVTVDFYGYDAKYEGLFNDLTYYHDVVISEEFYADPAEPASVELSDSELYF